MSHDLHNTPSLASEYDEQPQLLSASIDQGPSDHLNAVGTSGIDPVVRQLNPKQIGRRNLPVPPHAKRRRTYTTNQFHTLPQLEWLVADLIPKAGVVIVYGASGSGKSTVCLDLAKSVCTGEPWARHAVNQDGVVYSCLEGGPGMRQRTLATERHFGINFGNRLHWLFDGVSLASEDDINDLAATAIACDAALIIIDTLSASIRGVLDESSNPHMSRMLQLAYRLAEMSGATVLIVHHAGHRSDHERGASTLRNDVDTSISVSMNSSRGTWKAVKSKDGPTGISGRFDLLPVFTSSADGEWVRSMVVQHLDMPDASEPAPVAPRNLTENQTAVLAAVKAQLITRKLQETHCAAEDDGLPLNEAIAACVDKVKVRDPKHGSTRVREALDALVRYGYLVHSGGLFNLPQ